MLLSSKLQANCTIAKFILQQTFKKRPCSVLYSTVCYGRIQAYIWQFIEMQSDKSEIIHTRLIDLGYYIYQILKHDFILSSASQFEVRKNCFSCTTFLKKDKVYPNSLEAVKDIPSGATLLVGGFGICGTPAGLIKALVQTKVKDLTIISNNCGLENFGIGWLLTNRQIKRMVSSYVGENEEFMRQYKNGELELEIIPQGTLAERIRAGGAGIPAFYTPTGRSTLIEEGGWPIKFKKEGGVMMISEGKERRNFNGTPYIMETAIRSDFSLIKAFKADRSGNLIFRKSARNFNPPMCKAGTISIVEVEELVEVGDLDPENIDVTGIYVDRIVKSNYEKPIENLILSAKNLEINPSSEIHHRIARRAVVEFKKGMYVNLGIGIPSICASYISKDMDVTFQCENGVLGMGPYPMKDEEDADLINAAKESITVLKGASYFSSDESFAMIRGGHLDVAVLDGMQVSQYGDLANWLNPKQMTKGMGSSMDLVSSLNSRIIVCMEHLTPDGEPKIVQSCELPLTGEKCVDMIITERCVFTVDKLNGLTLVELGDNVTIENVIESTGCEFQVADVVMPMKDIN
ncbi:Succinyl-CoA:3-ketoacid coenzyme A transferase 1, mitochondrial [Trichinella pseudospiralis]|uniref:Succinyl-CoA:3-ketoacid-coenzyme A transferase n=1 Tax=Trichinella pseudospiralis TaxID=6337 RepID=A0A0V1IJW0_TRIPS|nr:Succinyl-CoA:3-ketoacid coenzyme A transferase 1, mitochondrial [Trichinella pseudospiralis]